MISESKIIVRYAETDKMGIVHHSVYPIWYEVGRTDFTKNIGIPYAYMEEMGILTPLLELNCKYIEPAYYEDELTIKTKIQKLTPARIVFEYEVLKNDNVINSGSTTHAFVRKDLRPMNMKKNYPEIYEKLTCHNSNT